MTPTIDVKDGLDVTNNSEVRLLEYAEFGPQWNVHAVPAGGVLERLWRICREPLMKRFPWSAAQATMFVLTGHRPRISSVEVDFRLDETNPASSRVTLVIDPVTTPDEVALRYKVVRDGILKQRTRAISEKHLRLAIFAAERPEDESWEEKRKTWNKLYSGSEYKGFRYEHRSNFIRDAHRARKRLMKPEYQQPRGNKEVIVLPRLNLEPENDV